MKSIKPILNISFLIVALLLGCTSNTSTPNVNSSPLFKGTDSSTTINRIQFCRKIEKETGKLIGESKDFTIMEEGWVTGLISLKGIEKTNQKHLIHFDWIDPDGNSFYIKRDDVSSNQNVISSSISISPSYRKEGIYSLRIYLFRALIAESKFRLLPKFEQDDYPIKIKSIRLATKANKSVKLLKDTINRVPLMKGKWVKASIDFSNNIDYLGKDLLFSFDWTGADDKLLYRKRVAISSKDSLPQLESALSIAPEVRLTGDYKIKIYLFDELLAQKDFTLLAPLNAKNINSQISFCDKVNKKTGQRSGVKSAFTMGNKNKVTACVNLNNTLIFGENELNLQLKWIGPNAKTLYTKRFNYTPQKTMTTLKTSIRISPKNRKKGIYKLQVLLFGELINEKEFKLIPPLTTKLLKTNITLCSRIDKKTGEKIGIGTEFTIKNKSKIRAIIDIENCLIFGKRELNFRVDWIGINGKSFYSKKIDINPNNPREILNSSISIAPKKRIAGVYKLRLYLYNKLINEVSFVLKNG